MEKRKQGMSIKTCARCKKEYRAASRTKRATYCPDCYVIHRSEVRSGHPNLKPNFFETIDSKDKAYWLGFMYADGWVSSKENVVGMELSAEDRGWVKRWAEVIGANFDKRYERHNPKTGARSVQLRVAHPQMKADLVRHGCVPRKSLKIRLPELGNEELDLAFLMGYFDGDGNERDTGVTSGSRTFLEDIAARYSLVFEIKKTTERTFTLTLGVDLFRKMLDVYPESMPRKRSTHTGQVKWYREGLISHVPGEYETSLAKTRERLRKEAAKKFRKFTMDPEILRKEVWEKPAEQIGQENGVTGAAVAKACKVYGIEKPGRGYWAKKKAEGRSKGRKSR